MPRPSKVTPQSTTSAWPSCSMARQFIPTSPRPPRGRMRTPDMRMLFVVARAMSTLADRRFVLVTGKGGVGKTTVCAAEALALAAKGKRVLVAMCNAKERLSTMLGSAPIGPDVTPVADDVWAVNMQPEKALQEYGVLVLHSRALARTLFDNRYTRT